MMKKCLIGLLGLWLAVLSVSAAELVILYTSDTHAYFNTGSGGWLKLAPLIRREFRNPADTLVIDCGDTLQGTLEGAFDKGASTIKALNNLKYDVWVVGNHDIEFGLPALRTRASEFAGTVLAGNLVMPGGKKEFASWKMFERAGLKIAVIGMTLPNMHDDIRFADELRAHSGGIIDDIAAVMPEIRAAKPDLIVLAMHSPQYGAGFSVYDVTKNFPEISVIIGAHSHKAVPGEKVGSAWYAQVGAHARELGRIEVQYDPETRRVSRISSVLLPVPENAGTDPALAAMLDDYLKQTREFSSRAIGRVQMPDTGTTTGDRLNSPAGLLMASAMRRSTGADLALLSINTGIRLNGRVTEYDLFKAMPYENTVAVIEVTAAELRDILNEQLAGSRGYYTAVFQGLKVKYWKKKVTGIYDEKMRPVPDNATFKLAVANYLLISNRFPVLQKVASKHKLESRSGDPLMRDCIRDYIRTFVWNSPVNPPAEQWMIAEK